MDAVQSEVILTARLPLQITRFTVEGCEIRAIWSEIQQRFEPEARLFANS